MEGKLTTGDSLSSFSAPGQLLGYFYQCRYALLLLLRRGRKDVDSQVSLEKFDDVAFDDGCSPMEMVQLKHHLGGAGSLGDSSPDWWKSLRVWSTGVLSGELELGKTVFLLITTQAWPPDGAASFFVPKDCEGVATERDPKAGLSLLKAAAASCSNAKCKAGIDAFNLLSEEQQSELAASMIVCCASPSVSEVRTELEAELRYCTSNQFLSPFCDRIEGWWFSQVVTRLTTDGLPPIRQSELEVQMEDLRARFERDNLPIDYSMAVPDESYLEAAADRCFVKQLKLIAMTNPLISFAIRDYYRAYQQRARWLSDGLLAAGEMDAYEVKIREEWELASNLQSLGADIAEEESEPAQISRGQTLFKALISAPNLPRIRDRCDEPYVVRGALHELSDRKEIGWHPDFVKRLQSTVSSLL